MPFPAATAVVQAERFRAEDCAVRQSDCLTLDVVTILSDQIKSSAFLWRGLAVSLAEPCHKTLGFNRSGGVAYDAANIGVEECPRPKLKSEIIPFHRGVFGVFGGKPADGSEQGIGVFRDRPVQIPETIQSAFMQTICTKSSQYWSVWPFIIPGIGSGMGQIAGQTYWRCSFWRTSFPLSMDRRLGHLFGLRYDSR